MGCQDLGLVRLLSASQQPKGCHSNGDTVIDLLENHGVGAIRNFRCDFNSAVDWTRCHDEDVFFGLLHPFTIHGVECSIFMHTREGSGLLPELGMDVENWPPENIEDLAKRLDEPF